MSDLKQSTSWLNVLRSQRSGFIAFIFVLLLFAFEEISFGGAQLISIASIFFEPWVATGGIVDAHSIIPGILSTATICILFVITLISLNSSRRVQIIYFVIFSLAILIQFGYWNALNRFFVTSDFITNITSPFSFWVDSISRYFNPVAFIPILFYSGVLVLSKTGRNWGWKGALSVFALYFVLGSASVGLGHPNYPSLSVPAFYRSLSQVAIGQITPAPQRDTVKINASNPPKNNIVLIIDESVRRQNLSLYGYPRNTTPLLDNLYASGNLGYWPDAIAAATCSVVSNAIIMTGLHDFPDSDQRLKTTPTIFQYAKGMGYTTHYIDGQASTLWNSLQNSDLLFIDDYLNLTRMKYPEPLEIDGVIGDHLSNILNSQSGQFIVVNKVGVHLPYQRSFPEGEFIWTDRPPQLAREAFYDRVNNYDSAIAYNSQSFFGPLLANRDFLAHSVILYASDHGQNLGELDKDYSHCGSEKIEVEIPLMIMGDVNFDAIDFTYPAHHANIFPTLLDLMDVPLESHANIYAPSPLNAKLTDAQTRFYLPSAADIFTDSPLPYDDE